jgi:hypothetical protein
VTMLVWLLFFPREAASASSARHSLRPLCLGRKVHAQLGRHPRREIARVWIAVAMTAWVFER